MTDSDRPMPPDPSFTPEQQLMIEIGWLDLWHALREADPGEEHSPDAR